MLLFQFLYRCLRPCCSCLPLYIDCVFAVAGVLVFGGVFAHSVPANGDDLVYRVLQYSEFSAVNAFTK
jgi:hypothetical protein